MTLGEKRVRVKFNPDANDTVSNIKETTADLINLLEEIRTKLKSNGEDSTNDKEVQRLISIAQTSYEEASMWAVKAVTSQYLTTL